MQSSISALPTVQDDQHVLEHVFSNIPNNDEDAAYQPPDRKT